MKSKIPCEPGPAPLMKLAQATGLCGGVLVPRLLKPPLGRSFCEVGEQTGLHHAFRQPRVHPVDADDDHLLARGSARRGCRRPASSCRHRSPTAPAAAAAAEPLRTVLRLIFAAGIVRHQSDLAELTLRRSRPAFPAASPTVSALPSM